MKNRLSIILFLALLFQALCSCSPTVCHRFRQMEYAVWLKTRDDMVVSISPYDNSTDTLKIDKPLGKIVCMSTSHIAFLDAIGCDSVIVGVSGAGYVTSPVLKARLDAGLVYDVGFDQAPNYEKIAALQPDILLAYRVSEAESPFLEKVKSLGIRVFSLYEYMEGHPLARAEYVKAFGIMTGHSYQADSVYNEVRTNYNAKIEKAEKPVGVLLNIPYGNIWYIPGSDNYMTQLISDAGGTVLGSRKNSARSTAISLEEAFVLSSQADFWLNPGSCRTKDELFSANPLFKSFPVTSIYNNTRRSTPQGGNDFWESGCLRPDLILEDLKAIFSGKADGKDLNYYFKVD